MYYVPDEGYYKITDDGNVTIYLHINGGIIETLYTDEYCTLFGKATYDTTWEIWQHFAGDLYFRSDSLLSAKLAPEECHPATVKMKCTDNRYCDTLIESDGFVVLKNEDSIGTRQTIDIYFYDDYIIVDGKKYEKMETLDNEVLGELIRLIIDPEIKGGKQ